MESPIIQRALISVSNKLGIVDFAKGLISHGIEIVSTGGTRRHLESFGIHVIDIFECTRFPEILDGRVKTLHPNIFAGILARRNRSDDLQILEQHQISPFELVVVNLYPFAATVNRPGILVEEAIEQIDIGGPSLIRAAAKNSDFVTVVSDPSQYSKVLEEIRLERNTTPATRRQLMAQAFQHTADYDRTIAEYFTVQQEGETFPAVLQLSYDRKMNLRYGENSHQAAAVYSDSTCRDANLINARQLNGKPLSYNNLLDLDSALAIVRSFDHPACAVIKHNNPCGAALGTSIAEATDKALAGDPVSAFGGVIGVNREVSPDMAKFLATGDFFIEAIVAPEFSSQAEQILTTIPKWKKNVRLIKVGNLAPARASWEYRYLLGGVLVQQADNQIDDRQDWSVPTESQPNEQLWNELNFGWHLVRFVKSNAITVSRQQSLIGVGAGQMSRVDSVKIALEKAAERVQGSILASDAFFPFPDSIELAAQAGVAAIIQPGGSVKDDEVIAACNQYKLPMVVTGNRHFRH